MSKLQCRCGKVLVIRTMEEDFLFDLIPQSSIFKIIEKWDQLRVHENPDLLIDIINEFRRDVYVCPDCKRLLVENDADSDFFDSFIKELIE